MRDIRKLQSLVAAIRKDGPTEDNLKQTVLLLADHIIHLQHEVDRLEHIATQARRMSRMAGFR